MQCHNARPASAASAVEWRRAGCARSRSPALGPVTYSHELPNEPRTAGRGPARVCPVDTPYKPHMTLYTNLLDRAKVDDGIAPCWLEAMATGDYEWKTFAEFLDHVDETSSGMKRALGLGRQEMVGVFSRSQYEWTLVEQSCNRMAYTLVPLYDTLGSSTVPYILNHTEMKVVFCAKEQTATLLHCLPECPHLKTIVQYESNLNEQQVAEANKRGVKVWTLDDIVTIGRDHPADADPPKPEDLSTICYTSGTTGTPKGVLVTHANFVSAVNAYRPMIKANRDESERFLHAMMITEGAAIGFYHGNVARILDDVQALHPTTYEPNIRQLKHKVTSTGAAKHIEYFYQALDEKKRLNMLKHEKYDAELFDGFKPVLGGRVRQILTGAAPITSEVKEFFQYVFGVPVLEAYGVTEASGGVACSSASMPQGPHVGVPLPGLAIRLADIREMNYSSVEGYGEVLMKGPNVFSGYYKQPELTQEVLDEDGWYATGDIGRWNPDGTLSIVDRKKHIFKLSQGEHIAPEKVEGVYQKSKFVGQVFVDGDSLQSYLVAVVTDDEQRRELEKAVLADMDIVARADGLHGFERAFTVENDLVTPTLKPKRAKLTKHFANVVKTLYATGLHALHPYKLSESLELKNRIVMSPLTRARCDPVTHEAGPMQVEYYSQRAGAGLIITEAVAISVQGFGWYGAPCLYTEAHRDSWKPVVEAVHAKGAKIFLQIWHIGRQGHPSFSGDVVGPSAIGPVSGHTRDFNAEKAPYELCRELKTEEISEVINDFCKSARLAKEAGFDGVDIHAANGYLPDTFLQSSTNKRTDKYGGSIENRARFLLELVEALQNEWLADRIGLRLSPNGFYGDTGSADNYEMCCYVAEKLSKYGLAYLATLDGFGFGFQDKGPLTKPFDVKKNFKGTVMAANSYTRDTAEGVLLSGAADLRFLNDWALNEPAGYETWFGTRMPGPSGYIDFPTYSVDFKN
ncbi:AMP-binding, conserved site [Phytophthora cactorum]|nr:AMP-binding, conserved site [Phytophthora cactorum]